VQLSYQLLRNTTSPDETATGVKSFVVNLPAREILKLDTEENLRDYIPGHNAKKRSRVHDAIRDTIDRFPQRFITRNSGFAVSAAAIEVDDNAKVVTLTDPSIINGAQSQGEIKQWIQDTYGEEPESPEEDPAFFVRAEIIVDPDPAQIVETAIARNTAAPVKSISQAGARGHLDELEESIKQRRPELRIRKSETDENVYDTRKILQYARLLMPVSVSGNDNAAEKLRPYKNPEQCLTEFSRWYGDRARDEESRRRYDFTVQVAPFAIEEYEYWERHPAWNGQHVWEETKKGGRACRRDRRTGRIVWVSPGLVFPILGAMSEFVQEVSPSRWEIVRPNLFKDGEMVSRAVAQFRGVGSDPMQMGRSAGVYDALRIYPATIVEVMRDMYAANA
jgi:hypothetical protein